MPHQDRVEQLNRGGLPRTWVPPMVFGIANEWHDIPAALSTGQLAVPSVPAVGFDSTDARLWRDPARRSPARTSAAPIVCRSSETSDVLEVDETPYCFPSRSTSASACHPRCFSSAPRAAAGANPCARSAAEMSRCWILASPLVVYAFMLGLLRCFSRRHPSSMRPTHDIAVGTTTEIST